MNLGRKIGLGFCLLIIIALALGGVAAYNMYIAAEESTRLAEEYVPEVDVALEIRRATNQIMLEMRGFGLSGEKKYYDNAQKWFKASEDALQKARKLADGAEHLTELKAQLDLIESAEKKYKTAAKDTLGITEKLAQNRTELDKNATAYAQNAAKFLSGQNEKFKTDLNERQKKVQIVTAIVGLVSKVRVTNFKAQASGDMALMERAFKSMDEFKAYMEELRPITRDKADIENINQLGDAGQHYTQSMEQYLSSRSEMAQGQKEMDRASLVYMKDISKLLTAQNSKLRSEMRFQDSDLDLRYRMINMLNETMDYGNQARMTSLKGQMTQDTALVMEAVGNLENARNTLGNMRQLASGKQEAEQIKHIEAEIQSYLEAMNGYLFHLAKLRSSRDQMDLAADSFTTLSDGFLERQHKMMTADMADRTTKVNLATDLVNLSNDNRIKTLEAQALRKMELIQGAKNNFPLIKSKIDLLKETSSGKDNQERLDGIAKAADGYETAMDLFLTDWQALQDLAQTRENAGNEMINVAKAAAEAGMAQTKKIANAAESSLANSITVVLIGLASALIVGILLAYFITRSITKPVNRMIEGLNIGSDQVAAASSQVSSSSQSLAEGASEQAAALEETSSSMEQMGSMTRANADNAGHADALMKEAATIIEEASNSMKEMSRSMEHIAQSGNEIGKIVNSIDEIAFQTNLLALNAAVEAARAGEAGAGFAVVADEVRALAMRAAEAAKNTQGLVEDTIRRIGQGTQLVEQTQTGFDNISGSTQKVAALVSEISASSQEQAQGIDQVGKAMSQMDKVTQQVAANAEESASASEELNAQAIQMKDVVGELSVLVYGNGGNLNGEAEHLGPDPVENTGSKPPALLQPPVEGLERE